MTGFKIAPDVGVLDDGETVYVAALPAGPIHVLIDDAAGTWRAATTLDAVATHDEETAHYLAAMVEAGLLIQEEDR
ncbi:hypothetical protein [Microbacterium profundi]